MSVFLPTKDQNLRLGDRAGSKPVLDVILEALRPNLDQFPVRRLIARISVKSLNICYRWLISTQHIDVSILDSHSRREVSVSVQLRLLTPLVASNWVNFTRFWRIIESRSNCVNIVRTDGRKTVTLTRVQHVRQLGKYIISQLISVIGWLGRVLCTSSDKYFSIISLDWTETDRYVKINVQ